jgi:hypothetical protein
MSDRRQPQPGTNRSAPGATDAANDQVASGSGSMVASGSGLMVASGSGDLVTTLVATFREQVHRALGVRLDGSIVSLAFVDHYLRMAQHEDREPILSLLASGGGTYFGEIVREHVGATWVGGGRDPRRLRLLVGPQFVFFSPVDQAYEAIVGESLRPDDPRIANGPPFDPAFHLRPPAPPKGDDDGDPEDDGTWLEERLSELAPVPEDHFHSLTCRFETLQLMLELLAAKHAAEGRAPRHWALADYADALSGR